MTTCIDVATDKEILEDIIGSFAKATNELQCAKKDINKIEGRISYSLANLHELLWRNSQHD